MLGYAGWYSVKWTREILFFIPFMQVLLIGPLVYYYTISLVNKGFAFSKKDWLHFVPAALYALYSLVVFITDKYVLEDYYFYANGRDKDLANWYQATGLLSMSTYLLLSLRYYSRYKKLVYDKVSFAESMLFRWIQHFLIAFLVLIILRVLFFIFNPSWGEFGSQFWYYISFAVLFFYIAVAGYSNMIRQESLQLDRMTTFDVFEETETASEPLGLGLNEEKWKEKLSLLMKEHELFKNPKLTLQDVAEQMNLTTKTVSTIVNTAFGMNFNDFVNSYRVEEVKEKMKKGEHQKNTLLGLALDAGFNSKATFNRAFKKHTSLSPKEFLENQLTG